MALSGLEIYKLLPRTNCGDCGPPTCLAFAMQLAAKKTTLDKCPHVSEEARAALEGAAEPPIRLVKIGALEIGNETVMFRHEETFHHPCGIAIEVPDTLDADALNARLTKIAALSFERVGQQISVDLIAVRDSQSDPAKFASLVQQVTSSSPLGLVLISDSPAVLESALDVCADRQPLLYAANEQNYEAMAKLAKAANCPLAVQAEGLDGLADLTPKIKDLGVQDMILDPGVRQPLQVMHELTHIRRLALKQTFRPLGYPTMAFVSAEDPQAQVLEATTYISKYANLVIFPGAEPWQVLPLLTLRQNLYTDPRVPLQVEPKLYSVGPATPDSPVLVTTNFSLTYFTVEGEVEASKMGAHILAVDTEGQSVLTAFASDKFTPETIIKQLQSSHVQQHVRHKTMVIPGYVAVMTAKLADASGWKVLVGPREASGLPAYLRQLAS